MIYIILRNGELWHGAHRKSKTVKAYTTKGMAEGVIKRDVTELAGREYWNHEDRFKKSAESIIEEIKEQLIKEFSVKEVAI